MKKYYYFFLLLILISCSDDKEDNEVSPSDGIYKVVITQSGDYSNYNKSLVSLTPDLGGQMLRFRSIERDEVIDGYFDNDDLKDVRITLVSLNKSKEIEFNFIINPIPVAPAMAAPMGILFTFYKNEKEIGKHQFYYASDFVVKQENLKFK